MTLNSLHQSTNETGFTLLEIMVALAILAIALVTIMQLFSGALRSAKIVRDYTFAIDEVKKKMDSVLAVKSKEELDELMTDDEFNKIRDGYEFEINEENYQIPEGLKNDVEQESGALGAEDLNHQLYKISITLKWDRQKEISFSTIKMLEKEE